VVSVREAGSADVYNLTVAECPEYFAQGILVHNCIDSGLRYAGMTRPEAAKDPHAPKPKVDRWVEMDRQARRKKTFI
jgi:hypothetical protein